MLERIQMLNSLILFILVCFFLHLSFAFSQQIPFTQSFTNNINLDDSNIIHSTDNDCSQTNSNSRQYFSLKQVLHHGGTSPETKKLFRKLEIKQQGQLLFKNFAFSNNLDKFVVNSVNHIQPVATSEDINEKVGINIVKRIPNPTDKESIMSLAKMSYDAYIELTKTDEWIDLEDEWEKLPFGWEDTGLRGYIFADPNNSSIIIAFKGTSLKYINGGGPTAPQDKFNDNLMFSCCCSKVDRTWRGTCGCHLGGWKCNNTCIESESDFDDSYYRTGLKIYKQAKIDYPNSTIWLTGHSLGGSIASLIALEHDLSAIVFQSPGELLYAKRIGLLDSKLNSIEFTNDELNSYLEGLPIYHFGHTADPVFIGACNGITSLCYYGGFAIETRCHIGRTCSYNTRDILGWKLEIKNHAILLFMDNVINKWTHITNGKEDIVSCEVERDCMDCNKWVFL